jgi:formamidopyrimidine-DNA glycosylase
MPELPEVEIVKRSLVKMANNAKIIDIKIKNKNLRYKITNIFSKHLIGQKITNISRRSKYLIFHFKKKLLLGHLGMSGKILILRKEDKEMFKTSFYYDSNIIEKHNHIYFILSNGFVLIYNDVRRFGFFKLYNTIEVNKIPFLNKLGLEPFSKKFTVNYFKKFVKNRKKNIKNLLMDQTFISGLGNIYVNEALFVSKILPFRPCSSLTDNEFRKLILNIRKILKFSILKGGSSIKNYKNTLGESGNFQQFFRVYNRKNQRCSRNSCKGKVLKIEIANRSSFYCNLCQI